MSNSSNKSGSSSKKATPEGAERRKARRRSILGTFSLFVVVPKKGIHRLEIHDISDHGIGFNIDVEGEDPTDYPVQIGDALELRLYLNQTLYLPLSATVKRLEIPPATQGSDGSMRRIGAEFGELSGKSYEAYRAFLNMFDTIVDTARIDPPGA